MEVDVLNPSVMDRVPGWAGRSRTVEPLGGGITNRNYRVEVDGDVFVIRIPAQSGSLLGIDRGLEHQASRLAATCGIGPDVVAFIEPEGVLVTRFIEGRPVTDDAVHQPVMLERIAQSLRRIHQAGSITAGFSPFRVVEAYALTATRHGGQLPVAYERARPIAADIERALRPEPAVLCHNDLLNANFIDDGASIRIVDWEYAGMGDRFFDFGNFAVNHQLSEEDEELLLSAYFGRVTGSQHARLRLMRLMSDYREAMWGVLQEAISELDFDFAGYAGKHFDRLLTAAGDPRYDDWLQQAAG
ncbi:MAG TPA: phosphotransferase [Candidatus Dormibacteraeota bacterium]